MLQAPLLSTRLNPLALTVTPPTVNVRMLPAVPEVDEFPSKMKVPGEHVAVAVAVAVAVGVGVCTGVDVAVAVGVGVCTAVAVAVAVGVGDAPGQPVNFSL